MRAIDISGEWINVNTSVKKYIKSSDFHNILVRILLDLDESTYYKDKAYEAFINLSELKEPETLSEKEKKLILDFFSDVSKQNLSGNIQNMISNSKATIAWSVNDIISFSKIMSEILSEDWITRLKKLVWEMIWILHIKQLELFNLEE